MFSRYRNVTATAALLVCLAAAAPSFLFLSRPAFARNSVTPTVQPGDPDEFETRVSSRGPVADKPPMSSDTCVQGAERLERKTPPGGANREPTSVLSRWREICRRVASYVSVIVTELDVR